MKLSALLTACLFAFPVWVWALGLCVPAAAALVGALAPAAAAARVDPARALS